jgi:hypothetical protein
MREFTTFEKTRQQVIDQTLEISTSFDLDNEEIYIVCDIHSRFSLYTTSENISKTLKNNLNGHLERIEYIKKDGFIYNDLQYNKRLLSYEYSHVFYVDRHIDKLNWFLESEKYKSSCPIVCFYSFKGGLGRTTALTLTSIALARAGYKVAVVDFDLEAPGLSSLFVNDFPQISNVRGIVDFMTDVSSMSYDIEGIRFSDYYFAINRQDIVGTNGGELILLPAMYEGGEENNEPEITYLTKLSKVNILFRQDNHFLPDILLDTLQKELEPDIILIDTRTGINDIGGLFLSRYSNASFLFFFGNKQNMVGLRSIIEQVREMSTEIYLVNSPIPKHTQASIEKEYFLNNAYEIFQKFFYPENNIPYLNDETARHFPIEIPYNDIAVVLENVDNLKYLLEEKGSENPYIKISNIIETLINPKSQQLTPSVTDVADNRDLLSAFKDITSNAPASEYEFKSFEDLTKGFYPRKDYKFIFDKSKFLILGEKGAGKTALFSVLSDKQYAENLARYLEVKSDELQRTEWIKGFDTGSEYPTKETLESLYGSDLGSRIRFWILMIFRYTPKEYLLDSEEIKKMALSNWGSLFELTKNNNHSIALEEALVELDEHLKREKKYLTYIYDYLDRELPENFRGELISALLDMWFRYSGRLSNIRAKIFLRKDIFDREISLTDKSKLSNHSVEITWEYDQLLNLVWKRVLESKFNVPKFFKDYFSNTPKDEQLGHIPELTEENNRKLLTTLLGDYMGGNNKAFPYNWIIYHVSDTHRNIQPRSILNIFSKAALKQLEANEISETPLKPRFMELVMPEVSELRVQDIKDEYPKLEPFFSGLFEEIQQFPVEESSLNNAINSIIQKKKLDVKSEDVKRQLTEIGVLYEYKFTKKNTERRYHIPDLYLFGMGLKRLGPGAHKVLFKKR